MAQRKNTFSPVSRQGLDNIRAELAKHGIQATQADSGSVAAPHGFTVTWSYNEPAKQLEVELDGPLFFMSMAWKMVSDGIQHFVGT